MNRTLQTSLRWSLGWLCILIFQLSLAACGGSNDTAKTPAPAPAKEAASKETVFDDMIATKARAQQQAEQATVHDKEKLDAAMKQAEESSATP